MADPESAARFEKFAHMRLSGRNDLIYRNYDLLSKEHKHPNITKTLRAAGQYVPPSGPHITLKLLQSRFMQWGYGVKTLGEIETLLQEFFVYQRLKHFGKKHWPYRDPDDTRRLHAENAAATQPASSPE